MDEESEYGQHEDDLESFEQEQVFQDRESEPEYDDPMSDQLETEYEDWLGPAGDPGREDFHSDG